MNEVFERTRQLGDALMKSEEYVNMKQAEQNLTRNADAAKLVGRFIELRNEMEEIMSKNEKDWARVQTLTKEIDETRSLMEKNEDVMHVEEARGKFSELINQVNSVLHFIVSGEMDTGSGCTGNCSSCGGCSAKVN
ncbi:MAG: YlbF family regulator [Clostridia bacterium]|nr:YlbF family regulator [Clostridia bacterium]